MSARQAELAWGAKQLVASSTPRLDAEVLLAYVLHTTKTELLTGMNHPLGWWDKLRYRWLIQRRRSGVPVAYLTGEKEFFGLSFLVNRHVLIPRPETETIVQRTLELIRQHNLKLVYEAGTGSGNIAVTLAHQLPELRVIASDISAPALKVAGLNARRHNVTSRIEFVRADLGSHIKFAELVVANLPYVPTDYQPQREIFHEPKLAVFAPNDGLGLYHRFLAQTKFARAVIELGPWQLDRLVPWIKQHLPEYQVEMLRDESGYVCGLELTAPAVVAPTPLPPQPVSVAGHHS